MKALGVLTAMPECVEEALAAAAQRLRRAEVPAARLDARLLLAGAMRVGPEALLMQQDRLLTQEQEGLFAAYVERRERREPVSRILGLREFWSMEFELTPGVLDPRPDSETLVEAAAEFARDKGDVRVLDLGTGSGCLLLAALSELPRAVGTGVDISAAALEAAERNARRHGLQDRARLRFDDWGRGLEESFDIILSNPPYIPSGAIAALEPEVARFEPRLALDGGADGLSCYRALLPAVKARLAPEGRAFIELGEGQAGAVTALAARRGLSVAAVKPDLAGIPRCLVLKHESVHAIN